jgi:hypothetical protein
MKNKPNLNISIFEPNSLMSKSYPKLHLLYVKKTNPIQTQFKPKQTHSKPIQARFGKTRPVLNRSKPIQVRFEKTKPIFERNKPKKSKRQINKSNPKQYRIASFKCSLFGKKSFLTKHFQFGVISLL